ncbi:hypothetical protein HMJ29_01875 [Hymenobacter taeanensis]|uniref:Uncharacterized protein n=1 Tax=Hymenobacter taeanensis TaxID=2735321 RepID=A0A6M6BCU6_9BACT|nr:MULTISPECIES: hypothetical protein [Hymenobacter]QJX45750.1 hypothetical protein HMJ29_01875 [Hymenobacter taeanensis]UOQ79590.1 hypothetical protein MUN83_12085 [Hymenobacter sp. 5414T-23]
MKKTLFAGALAVLLGVLLSVLPLHVQAQCIMCKAQVQSTQSEKDGYDTTGLNKGILYLMTVPYVLMGTVGYFWYRNSKKKKVANDR